MKTDEQPIIDLIMPHLISYISRGSHRHCIMAISIISHYIKHKPTSLSNSISIYIRSLLQVGLEQDIQLRQEVCRSFVLLLDHFTTQTLPHLSGLVEYMITCNQSEHTKVALEACDFWYLFARLQKAHVFLTPYLPRIIPIVLNSLIYAEEDLIMFGGAEEDNDPNPQDLPTRFGHRFSARHRYVCYDDDDSEEDEDDLEDEEFFSEWTLRKFSATALEALTLSFTSQVTHILLPLLDHAWSSNDWKVVESSILALGAAAEGGLDSIEPHLSKLMPFLITSMSSQDAHVRYIACWTSSRFSNWIVAQSTTQEGRTSFYEPVLRALLRRLLDKSSRVQEAACSALSTLEEHASVEALDPYLPTILNHLARALRLYRHRNLRLLYDTIGTLAESVGSSLSKPACAAALISPLISKWNNLHDTDLDLFPLLSCLTDIATSVGQGFLPFTEPVFTRCVQLVSTTLQQIVKVTDEDFDSVQDEFIVAPLDLLSGIVQGLGNSVEPFVRKSTLLPLLTVCAHYTTRYEVLRPTHALIGYLAKACFVTLEPFVERVMPELIRQLENEDVAYLSARNNAIWAIGEIAMRWRQDKMERYIDPILKVLIRLIQTRPYADLNENVVITLGRIGIHHAAMMAHTLPLFAPTWLYLSRQIEEGGEKNSSFHGFCLMIKYFPQSLNDTSIRMMLHSIGELQNPSDTLQLLFSQIVSEYRGLLNPEQWKSVSAGLTNPHLIQYTVI
ncbi:armadillo-type protein [Choanephora cucurbitarum]|nr:armadillo-type protein [Choanephora cucurbitarum]